jgi:hypothetical protein
VLGTIFFPQGIVTPDFLDRVRRLFGHRPPVPTADDVRTVP